MVDPLEYTRFLEEWWVSDDAIRYIILQILGEK